MKPVFKYNPNHDPANGRFTSGTVYHGTQAPKFSEFRRSATGAMGGGVYTSPYREVAEAYAGDGPKARIVEARVEGKFLNNREWSDYIAKHGWARAEEAARKDGWDGVHDSRFEDAVVVWDPSKLTIIKVELTTKQVEDHNRLKLGLRLKEDMAASDLNTAGKLPAQSCPRKKYKRLRGL